MLSRLQQVFNWLSCIFTGRPRTYRTTLVGDLPHPLDKHIVYILGEGEHTWAAAMVCPCGCGEVLHMSLHPDGRPRWALTRHLDGTVSLAPSIWRKIGCRSHFFLEHGRIRWCK